MSTETEVLDQEVTPAALGAAWTVVSREALEEIFAYANKKKGAQNTWATLHSSRRGRPGGVDAAA